MSLEGTLAGIVAAVLYTGYALIVKLVRDLSTPVFLLANYSQPAVSCGAITTRRRQDLPARQGITFCVCCVGDFVVSLLNTHKAYHAQYDAYSCIVFRSSFRHAMQRIKSKQCVSSSQPIAASLSAQMRCR